MGKQQYPEPIVGILIFNPKGKLFLMKSYKWKDKFVIPGGHIELGETMIEAVKREAREETGLSVYDVKYSHFRQFIFGKSSLKKKHYIFLNFTAKSKSTNVKLNDEGQEYVWVKPEAAFKLHLEPYTVKAIKTYLRRL